MLFIILDTPNAPNVGTNKVMNIKMTNSSGRFFNFGVGIPEEELGNNSIFANLNASPKVRSSGFAVIDLLDMRENAVVGGDDDAFAADDDVLLPFGCWCCWFGLISTSTSMSGSVSSGDDLVLSSSTIVLVVSSFL